ncbi:MAG: hypothetical protein ACKJR1_14060 [Limisphaerales bacterium]
MKKLATILTVLFALDALACRFNVRDVGFVDLGSEKYRLFVFVPDATPAAEIESLKSIAYATYLESNVKADVLTASAAAKGEAAQFLPANLKQAKAVLVSVDGKRSLPVLLSVDGKSLSVSAWDGLESVFDSPRRIRWFLKFTNTTVSSLLLKAKMLMKICAFVKWRTRLWLPSLPKWIIWKKKFESRRWWR